MWQRVWQLTWLFLCVRLNGKGQILSQVNPSTSFFLAQRSDLCDLSNIWSSTQNLQLLPFLSIFCGVHLCFLPNSSESMATWLAIKTPITKRFCWESYVNTEHHQCTHWLIANFRFLLHSSLFLIGKSGMLHDGILLKSI